MKISISLSPEDLAALDRYTTVEGLASGSAAIRQAMRKLGDSDLEDAYAAAWDDFSATGEAATWDTTAADRLTDAAR
jgi:Arc/MetJ-type ribon-helix-helix transcriptional regulator